MQFADRLWTEHEWQALLTRLISEGLVSWREVAALTLGHLNPSQVGTSLASSEGFKLKYGKGNVMPIVMSWFYDQSGKCTDCNTRLELQADHNTPRESFSNPLQADYIENMVLRCRRCNVVKRPSHELGGKTFLTAESALMWILLSFRPRTLTDFIRMCRLYGMTMADIRMQEGWAMAHWLKNDANDRYAIDTEEQHSEVLLWADGGMTRCWTDDCVPNKTEAKVIFASALPSQHVVVVAADCRDAKSRVQAYRYGVVYVPFSHYFPESGAEALAIAYSAPLRKKGQSAESEAVEDLITSDESTTSADAAPDEPEPTTTNEIAKLPKGGTISYLPPRGLRVLGYLLVDADRSVTISWDVGAKTKSQILNAKSRTKFLGTFEGNPLPSFQLFVSPAVVSPE